MKYYFRFLFILSLFLVNCQSFSQSSINKINEFQKNAEKIYILKPDSAKYLARQALELSQKDNDTINMLKALELLASASFQQKDLDNTINYLLQARELSLLRIDTLNLLIHFELGEAFVFKSKFKEAYQNYLVALDLASRCHDEIRAADIYLKLASIRGNMHATEISPDLVQADSALLLLDKAKIIFEKHKLADKLAFVNMSYGNVYLLLSNYKRAVDFYTLSLDQYTALRDTNNISTVLMDFGNLYYYTHDNQKSLDYYLKAFNISKKFKTDDNLAILACDVGYMYGLIGNQAKLDEFAGLSIMYAERSKSPNAMDYVYGWYSDIYEKKGNTIKALAFHKKLLKIHDQIYSKNYDDKLVRLEGELNLKHQMDLNRKEQERKDILTKQEEDSQKKLRNVFIGGFVLALILLGFVFRNYNEKKKANIVIEKQKQAVELQKHSIEEKNKEITDSIMYAKRIQEAMLPGVDYLIEALEDHFVLFIPKDIVSGDFYWVESLPAEDTVLFSAIDCTGHGVPGAFMSIFARNGLSVCVNEMKLRVPSQVLNALDKYVGNSLRKGIHGTSIRDGMDIALCSLHRNRNELQYAGAMNPLCIIRNGEPIFIKGDRFPIGGNQYGEKESFVNHTLQVQKQDMIYIFSDGYGDQFGGEKGKKFKYKTLQALFQRIYNLPVAEQRKILTDTIIAWKGNLEQVDDILIIGVRV